MISRIVFSKQRSDCTLQGSWQLRRMKDNTAGMERLTSRKVAVPKNVRGKRAFDIGLACAATVTLLPVFLVIAVAVKLTSKGPILHWSDRIGVNNRLFRMPKVRTMCVGTPQAATHLMAENADRYLTLIGSFLRRTSLDELPQLLSVLRGDMSLVGPRPALFNQDDLITLRTNSGVHTLPPGVTGWAQVNGRDELPVPVKAEFDAEYLRLRSLAFDWKILRMTLTKVLRNEGVSH